MPTTLSNNSSSVSNTITSVINNLFTDDYILQIAKDVGFCERVRNIHPHMLLLAVLTTVGTNTSEVLNKIHYRCTVDFQGTICEKPFHNMLRREKAPDFFAKLTEIVLNNQKFFPNSLLGSKYIKALRCRGLNIDDVKLVDGTYWKIDDIFADEYKGTRTSKVSKVLEGVINEDGTPATEEIKNAGIGIQSEYSILTNGFSNLKITAETANEKDFFKYIISQKNKLFLADNGYLNFDIMKEIDDNGSFYIIKGRTNSAAEVLECRLNGKKVDLTNCNATVSNIEEFAIPKYPNRFHIYDMVVKLRNGHISRCVKIFNPNKKKNKSESNYVIFFTNISRDILSADEIASCYTVRWQIELFFKNLKSGNNLRLCSRTTIREILQVLIYASIITYTIKTSIAKTYAQYLKIDDISLYKFNTKSEWFDDLLKNIYFGRIDQANSILNQIEKQISIFKKSQQSKSKIARLKTFQSVVEDLENSFCDIVIEPTENKHFIAENKYLIA